MKYLMLLVISLAIGGCIGPVQPVGASKASTANANSGRVTRAGLLAEGGFCNEEDICADAQKRDWDCSTESACVPEHNQVK